MLARWRVVAAAVTILASGWFVRAELVDIVPVTSNSMAPTVCAGDRLLVLRAGDDPRVGDLVVFDEPVEGAATLKRVVAEEHQRVEIRDAVLHVDGRRVDEPYVDRETVDGTYFGPVTVPDGSVFVMGDEREFSVDSRDYGAIRRTDLDGMVLGTLWSAGCPD